MFQHMARKQNSVNIHIWLKDYMGHKIIWDLGMSSKTTVHAHSHFPTEEETRYISDLERTKD